MLIQHPEFSDILVDINTHNNIVSRDRVNTYFYYDNEWSVSEVDPMGTVPLRKEEYILLYCKYEDGKHIYNF
jgi:hypothetical protein